MARKRQLKADIFTTWTPSICCISANTARGYKWLTDNLVTEEALAGRSAAVDHRCIADIILGAVADGLIVQDTETGRTAVAED